jgi:8-oxo-dGTP pyrophosphatase MutT (NUDIX family)
VLILRAFRNWDFPKGMLEPGESPLDAARRETREETGLADLRFDWGESFVDTVPYADGKIARYFFAVSEAGEAMLPISEELGRPEHDEFRWTIFEEAAKLLPARLAPVLLEARTRFLRTAR